MRVDEMLELLPGWRRLRASHCVLERCLERLAGLHPRLCPRQVLGVRIGQRAGELLGLALPRSDKLMLAVVEIDGCFADGVSVATGCWFGRRTLRFVDYGKVAATFIDLQSCRAVRIWPSPQARVVAERYVPNAADRWHAQLEGYRVMPATELLVSRCVTIRMPFDAFGDADYERVTCDACGEEIMNRRQVTRDGLVVCRACAGQTCDAEGAAHLRNMTQMQRALTLTESARDAAS